MRKQCARCGRWLPQRAHKAHADACDFDAASRPADAVDPFASLDPRDRRRVAIALQRPLAPPLEDLPDVLLGFRRSDWGTHYGFTAKTSRRAG